MLRLAATSQHRPAAHSMCLFPPASAPPQVRFFYSFTSRDNLYIVMEYLNGGDCFSLLRNLGALDEVGKRVEVCTVGLGRCLSDKLCCTSCW